MLRFILATTALAGATAFAVSAQDAQAPTPTPPALEGQEMAPGGTDADGALVPDAETAQDPAAPAPAPDGTMAPAPMQAQDQPPVDEGYTEVDAATLSADDLIGSAIETYDDQNVAKINDVILNADGAVENVVAEFGGVLGFGGTTVLLTMEDIDVLKDPSENLVVRTSLTPESLETMPAYEG